MKPRKEHPWYSVSLVLSYNAVYNFIVGGRGIGKTFGFKEKAIADAIKKGEQFIYLRRYKEPLKVAKGTFFADVEFKFPDWDFRVMGMEAQMVPASTRGEKKRPWKTMGYFAALSVGQSIKSVAFPLVTKIIFDEFIEERGNTSYLQDEWNKLNNFYNTVDRGQDKTRVYFLANSASIMNPYFIELRIRPDEMRVNGTEIVSLRKGFVCVHFPDDQKYKDSIRKTRFGQFIEGTEYEKYAVDNQFADGTDMLIGMKTSVARHLYNVETREGLFSVWYDSYDDMFYAQTRLVNTEYANFYTFVPEKLDKGKILASFSDKMFSYLRTAWRHSRIRFDKPSTRNAFTQVFKR
jgi:hypothetical protein